MKISNIILFSILIVALAVDVTAKSIFSAQTLENAIIQHLNKKIKFDHEIEFLSEFKDIEFMRENIHAKIDGKESYDKGNNRIKLVFYSKNSIVRNYDIDFRVKKYANVYTTNKPISSGSELAQENLSFKRFEITNINEEDIALSPIGRNSNKYLKAGEIVKKSDLQKEILIKRGDEIVVEVISGAVIIRANATALQDGYAGETIRLRRERSSTKIIQGKILEDGRVIINSNSELGMR